MSYTTEEVKYIFVYQLYFIYIGTFVSYHYHWVGTHLGGQLVPPRVPVHVFVITTDILSLIKNSISPTYWALSLLVSC